MLLDGAHIFESSLRVALCNDNPRTRLGCERSDNPRTRLGFGGSNYPRTRLGYQLSFTSYAHISIATPKSSTVPAAWEASQIGQAGLEGRTCEI